jgi:hypothetical protein
MIPCLAARCETTCYLAEVYRPAILHPVEVVQRYSKHDLTGVGLDRLRATLAAGSGRRRSESRSRPPRYKLDQRLDASVPAQVVADYKAGAPTTQLTGKYGLSKASVLRLLHEAGVEMRRQPFSKQDVDEAVRLYASGLSVAAIGSRLDAHPSKVWRALKARSVVLRPPRNRLRHQAATGLGGVNTNG